MGLLLSAVFNGVAGGEISSVISFQSHIGALFFNFMAATVMSPSIMLDFVDQRPIFEREYRTGRYGIVTHFFVRLGSDAITVMIQGLVVLLVSFHSIGFQSRFWYFWLIYSSFGYTVSSICILFASAVKNPADAKELIGLAIFPQALLSGLYVSISDLPRWIQWASKIVPLTYAFRLSLGEEFAFCGSPTDYQVDVLRCASGLGDVLTNHANYGNESFLTLEQTGIYWGDDGIREYSSLADDTIPGEAILVDSCWISPDLKLKINQVEGTYCDVTASAILGATFQPNLSGENILALEATAGYRTTYHVADDGDSFLDVEVYRLFLTNPSQNGLFNIEEEYIPPRICQILENACGAQYFHFSSQAECISAMSTLPFVQVSDVGNYVYTGNSTGCRMIHSAMANLNPELHCPHISWFSEPDRNGNYKCDDKNLDQLYHNFTADDMKLFERVAAINELLDTR
jgi:hypothetical protein